MRTIWDVTNWSIEILSGRKTCGWSIYMLAKVLFHQRFHENRDTPYTPYFHLKLEHSSIETGDDWGLAHGFPMDFLSISDQPILPYRRAMTMVVSKNQEKSLLEIINRQGMPNFFRLQHWRRLPAQFLDFFTNLCKCHWNCCCCFLTARVLATAPTELCGALTCLTSWWAEIQNSCLIVY